MSLRHAVLGLLSAGPASGYDLLKTFELSLENVWPATQSQLYAELGRLAQEGLVRVAAEGPRGRKEYEITEEGRAELRHWLVEVSPAVNRRSDMLLRVFFLDQVGTGAARGYLERLAERAVHEHDQLLGIREFVIGQGDDALRLYGDIALEWGLRLTAAQREWAEWAAGRVAALEQEKAPEQEKALEQK
ncbi:PadR family transcriptional regulator [Microbispora bryophytorum]|uniref:PadR family transcriptional regulator n=1 Tax=Microbispora bryophytorum TaxID=1460882 RepID=A0A8H9GUV6_9ACTN|nr:PadR family transcriptional regulator [Microbispora bryophytorum]MBD3138610.1 PadR family transcriptional regulator [Microbispora bryophytorum]TQS03640.1 PadR family transcriptional regulator [Microbispora bryophytorum]GGO01744.1 PadR family transcriptional regulator [Microbispora bryophytorum]